MPHDSQTDQQGPPALPPASASNLAPTSAPDLAPKLAPALAPTSAPNLAPTPAPDPALDRAPSGRDGPDSWAVATEHARRIAERAVGERSLQKLDAELAAMAGPPGAPDPATDRLRKLADLDPELRTQLHIIMGNIQLLRLEPGLSAPAGNRLDAMLAAGGQLLAKIHDLNQLSSADADFSSAGIDSQRRREVAAPGAFGLAAPGVFGLDVLVADDIEMNRDIASALLRGAGHRVSLAEDGAAALLMATKADFDVILMDVRMPGMDGLEATRNIRALHGARGQVPVIALTAKVSAEEVAACRAAGMSGHLAKPFRHDTLRDAVERAAASRRAASVPGPAISHGPASSLSTSQMRALIAPPAARVGDAAENGRAEAWVDIVSPWQRDAPAAAGTPAAPASQFVMKFTRDRGGDLCDLADTRRSCAPPEGRDQSEYYWLLFVEPGADYPDQFGTECELWRWNRGAWRSVAVPGASFSPDDMYRDGWRYCGPCSNPVAQVHILDPQAEPDRRRSA